MILAHIPDHLVNHKDINSFNFLVADDGRVCFIDFGIASMMWQERLGRSESSAGGDRRRNHASMDGLGTTDVAAPITIRT